MSNYPVEHDGPLYVLHTDEHDVLFYSRNKEKFMLVHNLSSKDYQHDVEKKIDNDYFWMMVAFIERRQHHAPH